MKKQFLESKFGKELVSMITEWDQALEKNSRSGEDKDILRTLAWCQAQWEVYRMAIKHFYGVEYHFSRIRSLRSGRRNMLTLQLRNL